MEEGREGERWTGRAGIREKWGEGGEMMDESKVINFNDECKIIKI